MVVESVGHVGGTRGFVIVSSAVDLLWMSVVSSTDFSLNPSVMFTLSQLRFLPPHCPFDIITSELHNHLPNICTIFSLSQSHYIHHILTALS